MNDILTYQTGIRISQDNILGSSMDLGGISGQNVKILIDGVAVIGRQNGNIDLSQINLNNVERIEIVEGPLSVAYGTNALAGTINIITKKNAMDGFTFEINPYYESIGNYNLNLSTGIKIKKHAVTINAGRNYFDGWSAIDPFFQFPKSRLADTNRFKTWKPKEQYFADFRYQTDIKNWKISPYFRYFNELITNRGLPTAPYYETAFDDYYHTVRSDIGLTAQKHFKKGHFKTILAFNNFNRIKNTYYKDLTNLVQTISETNGAQDTSNFTLSSARFTYNSVRKKKINYQIGLDLKYETAIGRRIKNNKQFICDYAIFSTLEWKPIEKLIIKPGLRYAYNTEYPAPLTPSINIRYRLKKITLRGAVARGFRSPTLKELYFDFVDINHNIQGNTDLLSENSWNYSAYLNWLHQTKKNQFIKAEYGFYYNDISNMITLGILPDNSFTYINIGKFKTIGNQISFNYRTNNINANINASYIGRYNPDSEESAIDPFSFSTEIGAKMSYSILKKRLSFNVFYKYNGALQSFYVNANDEIETSTQSPYQIIDASVNTSLLKNKQLGITLGVKNILNVKQINVVGQTQGGAHSSSSNFNAGRGVSAFLSVKYKFHYKFKKDEK